VKRECSGDVRGFVKVVSYRLFLLWVSPRNGALKTIAATVADTERQPHDEDVTGMRWGGNDPILGI